MALTISDFELDSLQSLAAENVQQLMQRLTSQLQEQNPQLELRRGVFHDVVLYYHAVLEAAIRQSLERYQSARSLLKVQEDPTLADDTVVDELLSNWGITRRVGTFATGSVTIELNAARSVSIPAGMVFTAGSKRYTAVATFISRTAANQVSNSTDRVLIPLDNGNFAFIIDVQAIAVGAEYKLNAGELITPDRTIAGYVTSYATSSFEAGTDTENNAALLEKLQLGLSARALSNRSNMLAYLRSIPEFASVTNQSIIGYGDAEMLRDSHTIFPISYGGRVDWYIRGQEPIKRMTYNVTATCVEIDSDSIWQFSVNKAVLPGFFEFQRIRRQSEANLNSGFEIVSDTRANDLTGSDFIPDIANTAEGAYSAFQVATVRFRDTRTPLGGITVGSTASYVCDIIGVPLIGEIQQLMSSRDVRSYAADVLIKAPVPCFVQVSMRINKSAGDPTPDTAAIRSAVVAVVNQTDFIGRLDGSRIVEAVHALLSGNASITELDLFGRIRRPDGVMHYIRSADSLVITPQPANMITSRTVQFFIESADVTISVSSTIPLA